MAQDQEQYGIETNKRHSIELEQEQYKTGTNKRNSITQNQEQYRTETNKKKQYRTKAGTVQNWNK